MCKIRVRAIPNASKNAVVSYIDGVFKVKVMAPPDGQRANRAIIDLLSRLTGVKTIRMIGGETARHKIFDFGDSVSENDVIRWLLKK